MGLEAQKPLLVARLHELMDKPGGGRKSHGHAALAGGEAESQGDVALACAAVAKRDDVLAPQDVFASRKLQDLTSPLKARVRSRLPSPQILATASLVLS